MYLCLYLYLCKVVKSGPKFKRKLSASASREESPACVSVSSQERSGALNLEHLLEHLRRQVQVQRLHKQERVNEKFVAGATLWDQGCQNWCLIW